MMKDECNDTRTIKNGKLISWRKLARDLQEGDVVSEDDENWFYVESLKSDTGRYLCILVWECTPYKPGDTCIFGQPVWLTVRRAKLYRVSPLS